ncbi:MAG: cytochrome C [Candidatus Tectomicrobia bacterium]|nr:cytochrome C [Candidatus Tectomicrobia bacterium]
MPLVFPDLVFREFVCLLLATVVLWLWSLGMDAPLEDISNPTRTPNPSKAPWYFLGLQEMLVYFDPWIAGVVLPSLIIVGLMMIPFVDNNDHAIGEYKVKGREFAFWFFTFGLAMWIILIITGTYMRGPSWQWYWPWEDMTILKESTVVLHSWAPYPYSGDPKFDYMAVPLLSKILPQVSLFSLVMLGLYFGVGLGFVPVMMLLYKVTEMPLLRPFKDFYEKRGLVKYSTDIIMLLLMIGLLVKLVLRLQLDIKYVLITPWFNI